MNRPKARLADRVAIVTGGGRGIGRAHAHQLAREGAVVVVNGPPAPGSGTASAELVADEINATGGSAVAFLCDCADWNGAEALIASTVERFGRLDILVNNAAVLRNARITELSEADWDRVIEVNLKGHAATAKFAARHWAAHAYGTGEGYGRIINTTSESPRFGLEGQANYDAAKWGIVGLTRVLARELAPLGVTVNAIAPRALTDMTQYFWPGRSLPDDDRYDPLSPANVSPFVAWLAGPAAAHVTAQIFAVYGSTVALLADEAIVATIDAGEQRWEVGDLTASTEELFRGRPSGLGPMLPPDVAS
jgi:NAD(P)-dependent dehydrogenase (short-subunit alcohol dehydrogenase family)